MADFKPFLLDRRILSKPWGGRRLESVLDLELNTPGPVGETWELYDRPDGSSRIRDSELTLRDLMSRDARALLGSGVQPTRDGYFPLLIKYVDATDRLSVQVHPDDEMARAEGDSGKTEAWVVLHTGDKARIICGLQEGVTLERLAEVAHTAAVVDHLGVLHPEVHDAIFVPAGTVHSLGPDIVVFEVQQNSDLT